MYVPSPIGSEEKRRARPGVNQDSGEFVWTVLAGDDAGCKDDCDTADDIVLLSVGGITVYCCRESCCFAGCKQLVGCVLPTV